MITGTEYRPLQSINFSHPRNSISMSVLLKMSDQDSGSLPPVSQDVSDRSRATQIRKEIKISSSRPPKTSAAAKRYKKIPMVNHSFCHQLMSHSISTYIILLKIVNGNSGVWSGDCVNSHVHVQPLCSTCLNCCQRWTYCSRSEVIILIVLEC